MMPYSNSAFETHWIVWRLTGVQRPVQVPACLYTIYSIVINTLIVIFPMTLVINIFFLRTAQEFFECLSVTIMDTIAIIKYLHVFFVLPQLLEIQLLLNRLDASIVRSASPVELEALNQAIRTTQRLLRTFVVFFSWGMLQAYLKPCFATERILLFPAWFYVDWQSSTTAYVTITVYQALALWTQAMHCLNCDAYPTTYLLLLSGHMRALELRIQNIGYRKNDAASSLETLIDCIDDYVCVLDLYKTIQRVLSIPSLLQLISTVGAMCTTGMHILYAIDKNDLLSFLLSGIILAITTSEMFILCYFANQMCFQSEKLLFAFYSCNWPDQSMKFKRNLTFSMMRAQYACKLYSAGNIPLSMETFMKIFKFSYSIFTILLRSR